MIKKFNEVFGTGQENTVPMDHTEEGHRCQAKGILKIVLLAMCLDPQTKSTIGMPPADCLAIWWYVEEELVEIAFDLGPPEAEAATAAPLVSAPIMSDNPMVQNNIFCMS